MAAQRAEMKRGFPLSDHCDGRVFFNPGPGEPPALSSAGGHGPPRGLRQLLRWRFLGEQRATWPARVSDPIFAPPPDFVGPDRVAVTFINHASFLVRLPRATVLTDPIFSERCSPVSWAGPKRVREPGISLADLPRPDVVLVSHNHYDHMDFPTLRALQARFAPLFVTTLGNARTLARLGIVATELDWWQDVTAGALRITATPARHFSARTPFDRNRTLWGGFMVSTGAGTVLFAGDSGAGPHWGDIRARLGAPDVALLPIGAYEPRWFMAPVHMNPAEAVEAHLALGARRSVGMHFGTFQLTDEAIDAPLLALDAARRALGVEAFGTLGFGETGVYELAAGSAGSGGALGSPGLGFGGSLPVGR
jgi:L-ascorbate metabolism protein UlaG (beta-lactamase superfamily)